MDLEAVSNSDQVWDYSAKGQKFGKQWKNIG